MLSKNKVVKARKAIESLYDGICSITEYQKVQKPNKSTAFEEKVTFFNMPCRLSHSVIAATHQSDVSAAVTQTTKLFLAPEILVKPGSKITVRQYGVTTEYKSSGQPAVYSTHQEIELELFKGWA